MHPGQWQLSERHFALEGAGFIHFKTIADAYIDRGASARPALKTRIKQGIIRGLRLDRVRISEAQQNFRASYFYICNVSARLLPGLIFHDTFYGVRIA